MPRQKAHPHKCSVSGPKFEVGEMYWTKFDWDYVVNAITIFLAYPVCFK